VGQHEYSFKPSSEIGSSHLKACEENSAPAQAAKTSNDNSHTGKLVAALLTLCFINVYSTTAV